MNSEGTASTLAFPGRLLDDTWKKGTDVEFGPLLPLSETVGNGQVDAQAGGTKASVC